MQGIWSVPGDSQQMTGTARPQKPESIKDLLAGLIQGTCNMGQFGPGIEED